VTLTRSQRSRSNYAKSLSSNVEYYWAFMQDIITRYPLRLRPVDFEVIGSMLRSKVISADKGKAGTGARGATMPLY